MRLVWLALAFQQRRRLPDESGADGVRTCFHGQADFQILVGVFIGIVRAGLQPPRRHREKLNAIAIQREFHLVGLGESFDVLVAVPHQSNLNLVLGVRLKCMSDHCSAPRPERQAVKVLFLREIDRNCKHAGGWRLDGGPDGEAADFLRCRQVSL